MSILTRKIAVLSAAVAVVMGVSLCDASEAKADGVSFSSKAKHVPGNKVRVDVNASVKIGVFAANMKLGPLYIAKPKPGKTRNCRSYYRNIAGISHKVTVCVYRTKVRVTVRAWKKIFGKTVMVSDTKWFSIK